MKLQFPILIFLIFMAFACKMSDHQDLTTENIKGNWYFIDSICDPDPDAENKNYVELTFTDSLMIYYSYYPGLGPMYWTYELTQDSIIMNGENTNTVKIDVINENKISLGVYCNPLYSFELQRMTNQENTLREFKKDGELYDYLLANRERQYKVLKPLF